MLRKVGSNFILKATRLLLKIPDEKLCLSFLVYYFHHALFGRMLESGKIKQHIATIVLNTSC